MATIERRITSDTNDCRLWHDGSSWGFDIKSPYQMAGYFASNVYKNSGSMLFLNIPIIKGSTIPAAKLTLVSKDSYPITVVRSKIRAAAEDNPTAPTSTNDWLSRPLTTAVRLWDGIPPWNAEDVINSPDFKDVIQEIVNRDGWQEGNAILIFWDDRDDRSDHTDLCRRSAHSYYQQPTTAALLTIEHIPPPTIETQDASAIKSDQATLATKVIDDIGKTLSVRHNYGKTTAYGKNTPWQEGKHTNDIITQTVTELEPETEYHFRGEAIFED